MSSSHDLSNEPDGKIIVSYNNIFGKLINELTHNSL